MDSFSYQHVIEFTIYREGQNPSILDLILINGEGMVNNLQYAQPLGKSDHFRLVFNTNLEAQTEENNTPRYAYHRGNYQKHDRKYTKYRLGKNARNDIY